MTHLGCLIGHALEDCSQTMLVSNNMESYILRRDSRTVREPAVRVSSEIDYRFHDTRTCPRRILLQSIPPWNSVLQSQLNILRAFKLGWKVKYRASESIIDRQCSFPIGTELGRRGTGIRSTEKARLATKFSQHLLESKRGGP